MEKLLNKIRKFNQDRNWGQFHTPKNLAIALSVEASEILEHFQWLTGEESKNLPKEKKEKVREELADVFIYLLNLSDKLQIDLIKAAEDKIKINGKKYPVNKSKSSMKKFSEL